MSPMRKDQDNFQDDYKYKRNRKFEDNIYMLKDDDNSKQINKTKKPRRKDDASETDTDISVSILDNMSEDDIDDKSNTASNADATDNFTNLNFIDGDSEVKKYVRDVLNYAVKTGYLKPEDSTYKVLRVSSDLMNVKDNPRSSSKRARSSSDESQNDEVNNKSRRRKKRKIVEKSKNSRSRSRSNEPVLAKKKRHSQRDKNSKDKKYSLCQVEDDLKNEDFESEKQKNSKPSTSKAKKSETHNDNSSDEECVVN